MRLLPLVALTMIAFAANSLLNRAALAGAGMGPASFALIRLVAGAVVLLALARRLRGSFALVPPGAARLRAAGAASLALYMLGFSFAYLTLPAGTGALALFGAVQVTMFAGAVAMGEKVSRRRGAGAAVAFSGLVLLAAPAGLGAPDPRGLAQMIAAGIGWGIYSLVGRRSGDPFIATGSNFALAVPVAVAALVAMPDLDQTTVRGAAIAVTSGAVTSGLGYALWYAILPRIEATAAAVAQLSVPFIAALGGAALLGEVPGLRFWAAAALVIGGVAWSLGRVRPRAG